MILHPTNIAHFVMIFVQKTDKIFRQDKNLSYCECLVRFPDKKNTHYSDLFYFFYLPVPPTKCTNRSNSDKKRAALGSA